MSQHPLKQVLIDTRRIWDRPSTPAHIRKTFLSILNCGTAALGAEVYASGTECKLVYHTCKSRFCPSCGHRTTESWQHDLEASLPDISYVGITLTMPEEFWAILQEHRDVLHCIPAMAASAIQVLLKIKYGVRVFIIIVQQTFGGFLDFHPHLHIMVSAGGLQERRNRWIEKLEFNEEELMRAWRFAVIAFLAEALNKGMFGRFLFGKDLLDEFKAQHKRPWHVYVSPLMSKSHFVEYAGRYIRRPPIARSRLTVLSDRKVEYNAHDTRNDTYRSLRFSTEKFLHVLMPHVPDARRHRMRYFDLSSPRSTARTSVAVFTLLKQKKQSKPPTLDYSTLSLKSFGNDPLVDSKGERMQRVGQLSPADCVRR